MACLRRAAGQISLTQVPEVHRYCDPDDKSGCYSHSLHDQRQPVPAPKPPPHLTITVQRGWIEVVWGAGRRAARTVHHISAKVRPIARIRNRPGLRIPNLVWSAYSG